MCTRIGQVEFAKNVPCKETSGCFSSWWFVDVFLISEAWNHIEVIKKWQHRVYQQPSVKMFQQLRIQKYLFNSSVVSSSQFGNNSFGSTLCMNSTIDGQIVQVLYVCSHVVQCSYMSDWVSYVIWWDYNSGLGMFSLSYNRAYPVYTVGDTTMYSAGSTYYQPGSTTPVSYSQVS